MRLRQEKLCGSLRFRLRLRNTDIYTDPLRFVLHLKEVFHTIHFMLLQSLETEDFFLKNSND
jgi:hypothetical protein